MTKLIIMIIVLVCIYGGVRGIIKVTDEDGKVNIKIDKNLIIDIYNEKIQSDQFNIPKETYK